MGLGDKDERIKKHKLQFQNSRGYIKYNMENIVGNVLITMYDVKVVLNLSRDHFISYMDA